MRSPWWILVMLAVGCGGGSREKVFFELQIDRAATTRIQASSTGVGPDIGDNTNFVPQPAEITVAGGGRSVTLAREPQPDYSSEARYVGELAASPDQLDVEIQVDGTQRRFRVPLIAQFAVSVDRGQIAVGQVLQVTVPRAAQAEVSTWVTVLSAADETEISYQSDAVTREVWTIPAAAFPSAGRYRVRVQRTLSFYDDGREHQFSAHSYFFAETTVEVR